MCCFKCKRRCCAEGGDWDPIWVQISVAAPTVALWAPALTLTFVATDGACLSPANISKYWSTLQIYDIYPLFWVIDEGHATFSSKCLFQLTNAISLNSTQGGYILLPSSPVQIRHIWHCLKILLNFVLIYLDYICSMGLCDVHAIHHSVLCREVKSGNWVRISAATPTVALWREPAWPTLHLWQ